MATAWIFTAIIDGMIVIIAAFFIHLALQWRKRRVHQSARTHSLAQAKKLMAQGHYSEALTQLSALASPPSRKLRDAVEIYLCQGICLREIGILHREPDSLRAAIPHLEKAYRLASTKNPLTAAKVLYELSSCYLTLADFESKENLLSKALATSKEGILKISAKSAPIIWALLHYQIGICSYQLSQIQPIETLNHLTVSIAALMEACQHFSEKKQPREWAMAQLALSHSHRDLAHFQDTPSNLNASVDAATRAAGVFTYQAHPPSYAAVQLSLGDTYLALYKIQAGGRYLAKAFRAFKQSLRIYEPSLYPLEYGRVHQRLQVLYQLAAEATANPKYLQRSINSGDAALTVFTLKRYPHNYASVFFHQGVCFSELANYTNEEANLTRALAALDETTKVYFGRAHHEIYLDTQWLRGNILYRLAGLKQPQEHLSQALVCLKPLPEKNYAQKNPRLHQLLGDIYQKLASFYHAEDNLSEAISAYESALTQFPPDTASREHAAIQYQLGQCRLALGIHTDRAELFKKAIQALEIAETLFEKTSENGRLQETLNSLGQACRHLARFENVQANLEKALSCYHRTLQLGEDRSPEMLIPLYRNQGLALKSLSRYKSRLSNLDQAAQAFQKALRLYPAETSCLEQRLILIDLGETFVELAEVTEKEYNLNRARNHFEKAIDGLDPKEHPLDYARLHNLIGNTLLELSDFGNGTTLLNQAIKAFNTSLGIYSLKNSPEDYAATLNALGVAYQKLAEISSKNREIDLLNAIQSLKEALRIYTFRDYPAEYGMIQNNLGSAYSLLAETQNRDQNLKLALNAFEEAARIYTPENYPDNSRKVRLNMEKIRGRFRLPLHS